jgi:WD40 repeat protein
LFLVVTVIILFLQPGPPGKGGSSSSLKFESEKAGPGTIPELASPARAFGKPIPKEGLAKPVGGMVQALAFSPDGRFLAAGDREQKSLGVSVWDFTTGKEVQRFWAGRGVLCLAFTPDGNYLIASGYGFMARRHLETRNDFFFFREANRASSLALSKDGSLVAAGMELGIDKGSVRLWDWGPGDPKERRAIEAPDNPARGVKQVAFSPHDGLLGIASWNGKISLHDPATRESKHPPPVESRPDPPVFAFAPNGPVLVVGTSQFVRRWDYRQGVWVGKGLTVTPVLYAVAVSGDNNTVAGVGRSPQGIGHPGEGVLWDLVSGHSVPLKGHDGSVLSLAFSPDGTVLATGGDDGQIRFWDVRQMLKREP